MSASSSETGQSSVPTDAARAGFVGDGVIGAAFAASQFAMAICNGDGYIVEANVALADFLGCGDTGRLRGESFQDFLVREDRRANPGANDRAFIHSDGAIVWGRMTQTTFASSTSAEASTYTFVQIEDVTHSRLELERLEFDAGHDHLTGLVNRRTFMAAIALALAEPDSGVCALLLVDIDRFKTINDALGHPEGDRLLETVAARLKATMRTDDVVCRLGGDEFAVLLRPPINAAEAASTAERLKVLTNEPVELDGQPVATSVSIGISLRTADTTLESLLREADAALYKAKTAGRNRCEIFDDELRASLANRSRLEGELRLALAASELELHYQPEVDLLTGELLGVEALARWPHPTKGMLFAEDFIELAEEAGLVAELGRWVLDDACHRLATWARDRPELVMRVNVSALQLARCEVVDDVRAALAASGVKPDRLCLEITETAVMTDVERSMRVLADLHDVGVQIAIDDFGTGFSSLAYLKRFPVEILKIDRSFVEDVADDADGRAIVTSVLLLARSLDLDVIAEGIETVAQRQALIDLGCSRGQGHLFAAALSSADMAEWMSRP